MTYTLTIEEPWGGPEHTWRGLTLDEATDRVCDLDPRGLDYTEAYDAIEALAAGESADLYNAACACTVTRETVD